MNTPRTLAAEYELTPEDWEAVNVEHLVDSPLYREASQKTRVIVGLLFLTLALFSLVLGSLLGGFVFALAGPAMVAAVGPLQRSAQENSMRKLSRQGVSNGLFGPHRVEVRREGLFHATDAYESLIRWHAIEGVRERAGHFFVYTGPNAFLPIPVTAFHDATHLREFSDAFHQEMARGLRQPEGPSMRVRLPVAFRTIPGTPEPRTS
jgi:hypothetical protein